MILPPITIDGDESGNVLPLGVPFKKRDEERQFAAVPAGKCQHYSFTVTYIVDEKSDTVECGACGERLNPMWVLKQLMDTESRYARHRASYVDEMKRLKERSRTKCRHCGEMTPISSK